MKRLILAIIMLAGLVALIQLLPVRDLPEIAVKAIPQPSVSEPIKQHGMLYESEDAVVNYPVRRPEAIKALQDMLKIGREDDEGLMFYYPTDPPTNIGEKFLMYDPDRDCWVEDKNQQEGE